MFKTLLRFPIIAMVLIATGTATPAAAESMTFTLCVVMPVITGVNSNIMPSPGQTLYTAQDEFFQQRIQREELVRNNELLMVQSIVAI